MSTDHNYGTSSVLLRQNYPSKPPPASNIDTTTLVKAVVNDMTSAEKGGQWLLSSYAPFKEKPAFPGFEDHSMEEVRHLFYESVKTGGIDQYKQNLQMMLQQAMMKIKALQNPSPEAVAILKGIYDTAPSSSNQNQSPFGASVFGQTQPQSQNVFANTANNKGIFGGVPPQQSVFANTNAIFGGGQASGGSIFASQNQSKSIFGGAQASRTAVFGGAQPSGSSVFGGAPVFSGCAQQQQQQQSIFGKQQPQQPLQGSPFGQQLPFAPQQQQQQNVFQQQSINPQASTPAAVSPFGAPPNATFSNTQGPFGAPQSGFGVPQAATQVVAPTPQNKPSYQHTQNIFGNLGLQANTTNVFGNTVQAKSNENFYSKLEDLTEDEIKWFQTDDLDILKIPEKPPTYEMCFKV